MSDIKEKIEALRKALLEVVKRGDLSCERHGERYVATGLCWALDWHSDLEADSYTLMNNFMSPHAGYLDEPKELTPLRMTVVLLLLELDDDTLALFYEAEPTV
jgi:hypothetical protein